MIKTRCDGAPLCCFILIPGGRSFHRTSDSSSLTPRCAFFCFSLQWECAWFSILTTSFLLLLCWAYFWLVAQNDFNEFNWWVRWGWGSSASEGEVRLCTSVTDPHPPIQAGVQSLWGMEGWDGSPPCIYNCGIHLRYILDGEQFVSLQNKNVTDYFFDLYKIHSFLSLSQILALFHISLGQQLNLYWVHKVQWVTPLPVCTSHTWSKLTSSLCRLSGQIGVLATLLTTVSGIVSVDDIWSSEWDILLVSLQVRSLSSLLKLLGWVAAALPAFQQKWCCPKTFVQKLLLAHVVLWLRALTKMWPHPFFPPSASLIFEPSESLIDTLCVMCLCSNRPRHRSCTLEPWQQSRPSAGWSLDMWFAGRDPVRAHLCFLQSSLLWLGSVD